MDSPGALERKRKVLKEVVEVNGCLPATRHGEKPVTSPSSLRYLNSEDEGHAQRFQEDSKTVPEKTEMMPGGLIVW